MSLIIVWPFFVTEVCIFFLNLIFPPLENFPCDFGVQIGERDVFANAPEIDMPVCTCVLPAHLSDLPGELAGSLLLFWVFMGWAGAGEGCSACREWENEWLRMCSSLSFLWWHTFLGLIVFLVDHFLHLFRWHRTSVMKSWQISVLLPQILLCGAFKSPLNLKQVFFSLHKQPRKKCLP